MTDKENPILVDLLKKYIDRWNDCEGLSEMTLLRLTLLRELIQELHSEKSRFLANGRKQEAQLIKDFEPKVRPLRDYGNLSGQLNDLLFHDPLGSPEGTSPGVATKKRRLPEKIFRVLERDKLTRHDRAWEFAISAEATSLNWNFWTLDAWVKIAEIEEWEKSMKQHLWPHGIVLFTESLNDRTEEGEALIWQGRWYIVLHNKFQNSQDLLINLATWPGFPEKPPIAPRWKLLYT